MATRAIERCRRAAASSASSSATSSRCRPRGSRTAWRSSAAVTRGDLAVRAAGPAARCGPSAGVPVSASKPAQPGSRSRIRPKRKSSSSTSSSRPVFSADPSSALRASSSRPSTRSIDRDQRAATAAVTASSVGRCIRLAEQLLGQPRARRLRHRRVGQVAPQRRLTREQPRDREQLVAQALEVGGARPGPRRRRAGRSGRRATPGWPPGARAPSAAPAAGRGGPAPGARPRPSSSSRKASTVSRRRPSSARDAPMSRSASWTDRPPISPRSWRTACSRCAPICSSPLLLDPRGLLLGLLDAARPGSGCRRHGRRRGCAPPRPAGRPAAPRTAA